MAVLDELARTGSDERQPPSPKVYGVALAYVIDNCDKSREGRVQIRLPWLKGAEPWARVAVPMAGDGRGTYFMPQKNDEVLVAFENGDTNAPYIVGSLWNGPDRVPVDGPEDASSKQVIRTSDGHEIVFDGKGKSISITSARKQRLTIGPAVIEMHVDTDNTDLASITLDTQGRITISASKSLTLKAPTLSLEGTDIKIAATASAKLDGGPNCTIKGGTVFINTPSV